MTYNWSDLELQTFSSLSFWQACEDGMQEHGSVQTDAVLEKELRILCLAENRKEMFIFVYKNKHVLQDINWKYSI